MSVGLLRLPEFLLIAPGAAQKRVCGLTRGNPSGGCG